MGDEEKYYRPALKEFHHGFEYERNHAYRDGEVWRDYWQKEFYSLDKPIHHTFNILYDKYGNVEVTVPLCIRAKIKK